MVTFKERAAHSVYRMFSGFFYIFCNFSYFLLWVLSKLKDIGYQATSLSTYDFSTMYTT